MSQTQTCPDCGTPLPAGAPAGVCPKCLAKVAVGDLPADDIPSAQSPATGTDDTATIDNLSARQLATDADDTVNLDNLLTQPPATGAAGKASPEFDTQARYFGDYELLEEIGRGGMGLVYRARQVRLNRTVALKMILAGKFAGDLDLERFHMEAEAAAQLDHPGIVPIYEVGEHEGHHYFSMAFVEGESLDDRLKRGPLHPREAAELIRKVAEAIAYAHQRKVIHRDLKPANILIDTKGEPKVADFGLAKKVEADSNLTTTGQILGTPGYMPPEQAAGVTDAIGPSSDIYSLGAMLYAMITGRPPFQSATVMDTLVAVLQQEPVAPRQLNAAVDPDLETICLKCLQKDTSRRYETAEDLGDELDRYLNGEPIVARPIGQIERAWRWCRRKPMIAGLAAAVVLLLVTGSVVSTYFAINAQRQKIRADRKAGQALQEKDRADKARQAALQEKDRADEARQAALQEKDRADEARQAALQEKDRAERLLYASQISLVQREWNDGNVGTAYDLLGEIPDNLRSWEYDYALALVTPESQFLLKGRGYQILPHGVAFSPDGRRIVTGTLNETAKMWDAATGREMFAFKGHRETFKRVAFSPDGKRIVSGSFDKTIKVWDASTGQEMLMLKGHTDSVSSVAFSLDGKRIVSGSDDNTLKVWDAGSGQEMLTLKGHTDSVSSVAFSPDGKRIVSGSHDKTAKVWDAVSGQETFFDKTAKVWDAVSRQETVKVWDLATGQEAFTLRGHKAEVSSVAFSSDGKRIVSGSKDHTLKVWDAATGREMLTLKGHQRPVFSVAFSADGNQIVSGSDDNTLKVWDAATGQETLSFREHVPGANHQGYTRMITTHAGKRIVNLSKVRAGVTVTTRDKVVAPETLTLKGHQSPVRSVAISPDGKRIVSGGGEFGDETGFQPRKVSPGELKVWDGATGQETFTLRGHKDLVSSVAFSPDGKRIVSGSFDKTIKVWDASTGQEMLMLKGHTGSVSSVAFSPDGQQIVSGGGALLGKPSELKVWDTATGREMLALKGHGKFNMILCVAFSPDGKRIVSGALGDHSTNTADKALKVWDLATGQETFALKGHELSVYSVAYSADGKRIVSGSADKTLKVWDAATGQEILTLKGHRQRVLSVVFSPDGNRIVSGGGKKSFPGELKVWDTASGQEMLALKGHQSPILTVAFSLDGNRIVSGSEDSTLKVWDASSRRSSM